MRCCRRDGSDVGWRTRCGDRGGQQSTTGPLFIISSIDIIRCCVSARRQPYTYCTGQRVVRKGGGGPAAAMRARGPASPCACWFDCNSRKVAHARPPQLRPRFSPSPDVCAYLARVGLRAAGKLCSSCSTTTTLPSVPNLALPPVPLFALPAGQHTRGTQARFCGLFT